MTAEIQDWNETKLRLQQRWPGLPADDLEASQGNRDALLALLQGRLGYARPNAEQDLDEILEGASIVPEDVADERTHTGTSGPVGPTTDATDFARAGKQAARGAGTNRALSDGERGELPNQPPEMTSIDGGGAPAGASRIGTSGEGTGGGSGQRPVDSDRWGHDRAEMHDAAQGMRSLIPKVAAGLAGLGLLALALRTVIHRRKRHESKTEQAADQARRLLADIAERMPTVEEVRARVMAIEEMRNRKDLQKKLAKARG